MHKCWRGARPCAHSPAHPLLVAEPNEAAANLITAGAGDQDRPEPDPSRAPPCAGTVARTCVALSWLQAARRVRAEGGWRACVQEMPVEGSNRGE